MTMRPSSLSPQLPKFIIATLHLNLIMELVKEVVIPTK